MLRGCPWHQTSSPSIPITGPPSMMTKGGYVAALHRSFGLVYFVTIFEHRVHGAQALSAGINSTKQRHSIVGAVEVLVFEIIEIGIVPLGAAALNVARVWSGVSNQGTDRAGPARPPASGANPFQRNFMVPQCILSPRSILRRWGASRAPAMLLAPAPPSARFSIAETQMLLTSSPSSTRTRRGDGQISLPVTLYRTDRWRVHGLIAGLQPY